MTATQCRPRISIQIYIYIYILYAIYTINMQWLGYLVLAPEGLHIVYGRFILVTIL